MNLKERNGGAAGAAVLRNSDQFLIANILLIIMTIDNSQNHINPLPSIKIDLFPVKPVGLPNMNSIKTVILASNIWINNLTTILDISGPNPWKYHPCHLQFTYPDLLHLLLKFQRITISHRYCLFWYFRWTSFFVLWSRFNVGHVSCRGFHEERLSVTYFGYPARLDFRALDASSM